MRYIRGMKITESAPRTVGLSASAASRIKTLNKGMLRLSVSGGGCQGFQYKFDFSHDRQPDDQLYEYDGAALLVDDVSLDLVAGAEVNFVENMMGSYFEVRNPNATSSCGCGTSFSIL